MKKSIAALALAGTIALTGTAPAFAANYPAPPANAAVSDGVVGPGEAFTFSARGFFAGEPLIIRVTPGAAPAATGASIAGGASRSVPSKISVLLAAQEINATADAAGAVAIPLTISEPGTYTITATGVNSGFTSDPVTVTVAGEAAAALPNAGGSTGAGLANTGADSSLILWSLVGGGALVAGAASVVVVRRRANAEASA
ncbi:LPXTG cell wall anchor domain-containing protein [Arthrobacter sp. ISL-5]|uniref:LPXTG cell wall anchor domain-containing protein n=1 Tax=Arthrobacter sp. ISL-5 TaxID=2819111 RepID=UPI001BE59A6F|nr:LPXTG cell wall anchor domain-containing protein [Arthrobacter sp. ISL-5]MBT2552826.1 LPXTG cell wall anchor domain-containing protein [Arthrobacter sp. ISL-5]